MEVQARSTALLTVQPILAAQLTAAQVMCPEHMPDVVAVIPAFNEERFIASVVISALQYVGRVIVVDDGSSDLTAFLAELAGDSLS